MATATKNRTTDETSTLEPNFGDNGNVAPSNGKAKKPLPGEDKPIRLLIPKLNAKLMEVKIHGITPLICRAWDDKTKQQLADKAKGEKKAKSRDNVVPAEVFNAARYISTEGWDGVPASAFKAALVDAVACLDIPKTEFSMTLAKKSFFIMADGIDKAGGADLVRIYSDKPEMLERMLRTTTGMPYMSYRPLYRDWYAILRVEYNATRIDPQGVLNLLANAGYYVGVGEHRPSAPESKTGSSGRWEVMDPTERIPQFAASKAKRSKIGKS